MAVVVVRNHLFTWRYRHHPLPLEFRRRVCRRFPISSSSLSLFPKVYTVYSMDYILFSQNISLGKRDTTRASSPSFSRGFFDLFSLLGWCHSDVAYLAKGDRDLPESRVWALSFIRRKRCASRAIRREFLNETFVRELIQTAMLLLRMHFHFPKFSISKYNVSIQKNDI